MNRWQKAVLLVSLFGGLASPRSGAPAERKNDLRIAYSPPRISVEAHGVKLRDVLREISVKVGFDLAGYGIPDRDFTVSIQEATVEEVLRQLLRGENYGVIYREKDGVISRVLFLSSPAYAHATPMSESPQTGTVRSQERLTILSSAPSYQPATPQQKRKNREENEPRVEEILRVHAISALAGSNSSLQSSTPNVPQSLGNSTPAFLPTGTTSFPRRSLGEMNDSLAMTTRIAQQNLKGLVDSLATATHSLRNSSANR
jgi:hypothetical protein